MARIFTKGQLKTRAQQRCDLENSSLIGDTAGSSEWDGLLSTAYGELWSEVAKCGARYWDRIHTFSTIAATNATGTVTHVAVASLVDGETVVLNDGYGEIVFEFDVNGTGVTAGREQVDVSGDTTAENVESTFNTAVNAATHFDGRAIAITASSGGTGISTLTHDETGEIGNQSCYHSVANASFSVTDMTGGGVTYRIPQGHLSTIMVYYAPSSGQWLPLEEVPAQEYHRYSGLSGTGYATGYSIIGEFIRLVPTPSASQTYKMLYIPHPPDLMAENDNYNIDVISPDGEEFVVSHVAVNALSKEESDVAGHIAARERMRERIIEWGTLRSLHELKPPMVNDQLGTAREQGDSYFPWGRW